MIVPTDEESDQLTEVFKVPATDVLNCIDWPDANETDEGVTAIPTLDSNQTVALATLLASARLRASSVTVWGLPILAGAAYNPSLLIVPVGGITDHRTPLRNVPVTDASNLAVCPAWSDAEDGATVILIKLDGFGCI